MGKVGWTDRLICRYKDDYLVVRVFGKGEKKIIAFHGFGQNGDVYQSLSEDEEYQVYSLDLFYHGESSAPTHSRPLSHPEFRLFLDDFFRQVEAGGFTVIGFSMGAKYALSLLQSFPEKVSSLLLVAPDGVRKNFWYALATGSAFTQKAFKYVSRRPGFFFKAAQALEKMKLIDGRVRKFAQSQMNTQKKRDTVFASWVFLSDFFVPAAEIADTIADYGINIKLILGKYDRIIHVGTVKKLLQKIGKDKLHVINSGHSNILENFIRHFLKKESTRGGG